MLDFEQQRHLAPLLISLLSWNYGNGSHFGGVFSQIIATTEGILCIINTPPVIVSRYLTSSCTLCVYIDRSRPDRPMRHLNSDSSLFECLFLFVVAQLVDFLAGVFCNSRTPESMKTCSTCGEDRPEDQFMKNGQMPDGLSIQCNPCYDDVVRSLPGMPVRSNRPKYSPLPVQLKAAEYALEHVVAPEGMIRHHWSYREEHWADVIFLKSEKHLPVHRYITLDRKSLKYRDASGTLLNTREKHMAYLKLILQWIEQKKAA